MRKLVLKSFIGAALALAAAPAFAASPLAVAQSSGMASMSQAGAAVAQFYEVRRNAPLWLDGGRPTQSAATLVAILKRSPLDGLAIGPQLANRIEAALADPSARGEAEQLMSTAWVLYVQALHTPTHGMIYGDPSVRPDAPNAGQILLHAAQARSLEQHLVAVSEINPVYAALRNAALASGINDGSADGDRLMANLDRVRSIPANGRFVLVDAASQRLWMYEDGQVRDSMKVIVGKPEAATPMIASTIHYATLNPYWHVPENLVRKNIAPNVIKQGAAYLKARGYQLVSSYGDDAEILPAESVNWADVAAGRQTVMVRQLPGESNFMGKMKFAFANGQGIYLHDTPEKELFAKDQRTLSNGCVRLEDAARLGRWLLGSVPQTASASPEQHIRLAKGVPVFVTYLTAQASNGRLTYSTDVYHRDASRTVASLD